ncbi:MerR family transcriptional regulator [Nocardia panacis]|uniref:MerR family transcriptional regulator n=1 Tax=Nocardia panacis TaxID=2340916 RepID=A0A3A4K6F3_9NOCA|nr:MerR family transcriptional regulator [Nocardia panacis]RJO68229.1 MerR family transcriptional regulator [Nocardia panacis]
MRIGELAHTTGVSPRLLRYYEEQGLLTTQRAVSGHRRYTEDAPVVVGHIRAMLAAGLSTNVIRQVLPCVEGPGPQVNACVAEVLRDRLHGIEEQIHTLENARSALTGLLATTAS